jgi:hypothetical protein
VERTSQPGHQAAAEPTELAELMISIGPAQPCKTAEELARAHRAHHLIASSGILGSVTIGSGAAVLTLHAGAGFAAPAYGELATPVVCAVLIAVASRTGPKAKLTH